MNDTPRREFLRQATAGLTATLGASVWPSVSRASERGGGTTDQPVRLTDVVAIGSTEICASRLSIGTGSNGAEQRRLGVNGLASLLRDGLDRGISSWDTSDLYQTHPHVRAALRGIERSRVVITSKTMAKDAAAVRADVDRFRNELGTDYIDILLLHGMSEPNWPKVMAGAMEALDEAKESKHVRAVGCSLHINNPEYRPSLGPLRAAVEANWGDVYLVRINPFAINMDVDEPDDIPRVEKIFQALHDQDKAVFGMKILGGTDPHQRKSRIRQDAEIDESLRFALTRSYLSGFTIGISRREDIDDLMQRTDRLMALATS